MRRCLSWWTRGEQYTFPFFHCSMTFNTASQNLCSQTRLTWIAQRNYKVGVKLAGVMASGSKFKVDTLEGRAAPKRDPDRMGN